tara:strand:+ start:68 stop:709 length:642 start_codon:yes stop_codon:yes gene_type:complete
MKKRKFKIKSTDIITFFTVFILTSSLFGLYSFKDTEDEFILPDTVFEYTSSYNNRTYFVEETDNVFLVYLPLSNGQYYKMGYRLDPRLIKEYNYPDETINLIKSNNKIYLSTNPNIIDGKINVAILELVNSISISSLNSNTKMIEAFTVDSNPINPEIPLKSCKSNEFVIEFNIVDRREGVYIGDNCIQINAINSDRLINFADSIGYGLVGIN